MQRIVCCSVLTRAVDLSRKMFDISITYESDPNEKNFKAIHNHVQTMSGVLHQNHSNISCLSGNFSHSEIVHKHMPDNG